MSASQRIVNAIVNTVHPRTAFDNETIKLRAKLIPRFFVRTSHCNFLPSSLLFLSFVREQQISQTISAGGPLAFILIPPIDGRSRSRFLSRHESEDRKIGLWKISNRGRTKRSERLIAFIYDNFQAFTFVSVRSFPFHSSLSIVIR